MPNQLAKSKRRQSLAEHVAVLAVLERVASAEQTSVMALLREAARDLVKRRVASSADTEYLKQTAWAMVPKMPKRFKTATQASCFKREQRAFDQALLDMGLATPETLQERNSIVQPNTPIRIINFTRAHEAAPRRRAGKE